MPDGFSGGKTVNGARATVGLQCQNCWKGAAATVRHISGVSHSSWPPAISAAQKEGVSLLSSGWGLEEFWPGAAPVEIPDHLPEQVRKAFTQGESNLAMPEHDEAAATMFRRALDLALKIRFPDLKGNLAPKIKQLAARHEVPASLADWADEVRVIGNDGAHDLEGCSHEDAVAARDFVDALLRYLFSLPGMIAARRPPTNAHENEEDGDRPID